MTRTLKRRRLELVHSADHGNDLPPRWDGTPIVWGPWTSERTSLRWHLKDSERACSQCGALDNEEYAVGKIAPSAPRPHPRVIRLLAIRCLTCMHDTVFDEDTKELWDLDLTDYGDEGSHP